MVTQSGLRATLSLTPVFMVTTCDLKAVAPSIYQLEHEISRETSAFSATG